MTISRAGACAAALWCALLLTSCQADDLKQAGCDMIEDEVVDLSEGTLIKITDSRMVKHSSSEIVCEGTGIYSDRSEVKTRYKTYQDADGDWMIEYDTDEAQAATERSEAEQAERELAAAQKEAEAEIREAMQAARDAY